MSNQPQPNTKQAQSSAPLPLPVLIWLLELAKAIGQEGPLPGTKEFEYQGSIYTGSVDYENRQAIVAVRQLAAANYELERKLALAEAEHEALRRELANHQLVASENPGAYEERMVQIQGAMMHLQRRAHDYLEQFYVGPVGLTIHVPFDFLASGLFTLASHGTDSQMVVKKLKGKTQLTADTRWLNLDPSEGQEQAAPSEGEDVKQDANV